MTGRGIPTNHRISPRPINTLLIGNLSLENVGARLWFRIALQGSCAEGRRWAAPRAATRKANRARLRKVRSKVAGQSREHPAVRCGRAGWLFRRDARWPSTAERDVTFEQPESDQGRRREACAGNVRTTIKSPAHPTHTWEDAPQGKTPLRPRAPGASRCLSADRHRRLPGPAPAAAPRPDLDLLPPQWAASARTVMR
jgi:hypothetical protein